MAGWKRLSSTESRAGTLCCRPWRLELFWSTCAEVLSVISVDKSTRRISDIANASIAVTWSFNPPSVHNFRNAKTMLERIDSGRDRGRFCNNDRSLLVYKEAVEVRSEESYTDQFTSSQRCFIHTRWRCDEDRDREDVAQYA